VSGLAEQGVPHREPRRIHIEHKMKDRIQNLSGMFGRGEVGGFDGDDGQPDRRREPHPQDSLGGWSQLSIVAMRRAEEPVRKRGR
jgi:hypothetical protein